jgi:hypothetical protein
LIEQPDNLSGRTASKSWLGSIVNYAAIGVVASALANVTHEILGHLVAAWAVHDRIISISSVALQSAAESRFVAGSGTTANILVGAVFLVIINARGIRGGGASCNIFLWLFAAFNSLNSGYLVASAIVGAGDWAVVTKDLAATNAWRVGLALVGAMLYVRSLHWLARSMARLVERQDVAVSELRRLVIAAYVAGGSVMTLASVFNPISPSLILASGVGASFGLSAGMLLIPATVMRQCPAEVDVEPALASPSAVWICLALVVGGVFVAVLGPGIRFGHI